VSPNAAHALLAVQKALSLSPTGIKDKVGSPVVVGAAVGTEADISVGSNEDDGIDVGTWPMARATRRDDRRRNCWADFILLSIRKVSYSL